MTMTGDFRIHKPFPVILHASIPFNRTKEAHDAVGMAKIVPLCPKTNA